MERAGRIELVCEALPWGMTTWIVDPTRDPLTRELMNRCKPPPRKPDVSVQLQLPNEWDPKLATRNIGVTAAVETDLAPTEWVKCCDSMDRVVFPSVHSMNSVIAAGWKPHPSKARVVPESFPDALKSTRPDEAALARLGDLRPFTFLVFGQMTTNGDAAADRKNVANTVRWLLEEFSGDEEVGVLVKTNLGRNTVFDAYHVEIALRQVREAAKRNSKKPLPKLSMVHGDLGDDEVNALYRHPNVKALVSATRGEGFGLPLLEAAACDLPVIATAWSAHLEFLRLGRFVDLPCSLKPIPKSRVDNRIFVPRARWAEVDEADFKRRLRKFRSSSTIPREWARELGTKIRAGYDRESIIRTWDATCGDLVSGDELTL